MTTRTITTEQREWAEAWIAGLRDGMYTSVGGFPYKLASRGIITAEEAGQLVELDAALGVPASTIADVIDDALFNGMTVMEARTARGLGVLE